jgi:hypothetical protein
MARVAKNAKALQLFAGGLNDIKNNIWAKHLGGTCCDPAVEVDSDRLNPTINPENALVHTRPFGNRFHWRFMEKTRAERKKIVDFINAKGVGAQLEILVIPTFSLLYSVHIALLAEEAGFAFTVKTRNGTALPAGQLIKVSETDSGAGCGEVARVQAAGSLAGIGALAGATRVHNIAVSGTGGEFALEADVIILEVTALPAGGALKGEFDVLAHINYVAPGRSEAAR